MRKQPSQQRVLPAYASVNSKFPRGSVDLSFSTIAGQLPQGFLSSLGYYYYYDHCITSAALLDEMSPRPSGQTGFVGC